jgi:pimeloyl-ACP methyl ester carboxylesterase
LQYDVKYLTEARTEGSVEGPIDRVNELVVLVHGLYMNGWAMVPLAKRLQSLGYRTLIFSYPSVRSTPAGNALALAERVVDLDVLRVHYVAHSLGGIVVRHYFQRFPHRRPGRIVTLGTPHQGSHAARALSSGSFSFLLGHSFEKGFLADLPPWTPERELGSLAGTLNLGLGRLLSKAPGPGDGTVLVAETYLEGMADHICLPVSHTGMLFAPSVVVQVHAFLVTGRFRHCG